MKPVLVYSTGHIKFGVRVDGEGVRKGEIGVIFTPNPFPNFFTISYPLVQISFFRQLSTVIKIKDGGQNFC